MKGKMGRRRERISDSGIRQFTAVKLVEYLGNIGISYNERHLRNLANRGKLPGAEKISDTWWFTEKTIKFIQKVVKLKTSLTTPIELEAAFEYDSLAGLF